MKKNLLLLLIGFIFIVGCANKKEDNIVPKQYDPNEVIESPKLNDNEKNDKGIQKIKDNVYIQMTNDMYYNPEDYMEQKFEIEGLVMSDSFNGKNHFYIIRKTPGCCGNDGMAGLEVYWDKKIPDEDTWVIGKGIWKKSDIGENGWILVLYSLEEGKKGNAFLNFNY